ncbi:hypothetical protein FZ103_20855 [Streptomonospora sp. PA3]|uniref:hypothetical protein n=1 Tax=Streptomonospora sp. PA3 TaxID=2607326 RepID=UPI0012DCE9C0|nr:hypothetical protein [Streptomonospora sp. PA3]MUL43590.1 hypothetical protein [Streptomonospora sp. PA3]
MFLRRLASAAAIALAVGSMTAVQNSDPASADAQTTQSDSAEVRASAQEETTTVRYGPYTLPAAGSGDSEDGHGGHGQESGIALNAEKPCEDCFITGFAPNLTYADGTDANVDEGAMMHHFVLFDSTEDDAVCPGSQRIFSSGNERVASDFPDGYGLEVGAGERWYLNYDLMNMAPEEQTVYIEIEFSHTAAGADAGITPLTPLWLDVGGCFGSEYDAPEGASEESRYWRSDLSGDLVHMRGHLHHAGHSIWTDNISEHSRLCRIEAEEGGSPEFVDLNGHGQISDMPPCSGDLGRVERGDLLRTTARYEIEGHSHDDVMGIMTGWLAED